MGKFLRCSWFGVLFVGLSTTSTQAETPKPRFEKRWVYVSQNLLVDKSRDATIALIDRAAKSGYNGIMLSDYKFSTLSRMPANYFKNVEMVRKAAEEAKIEIIPALFSVGYSNGLLSNDVNMAEGLPVKDAPFVVKGRTASPASDPVAKLVNGDLEETKGDKFVGFSFQDDPGKTTFPDREVFHHGKVSCRMQDIAKNNPNGVCRLVQPVKVRPNACYRLSCWVKTKDLVPSNSFHLLALGASGKNTLTFHEGELKATQDWTHLEVVFNSLDEKQVNIYAGQWGGKTGTMWVDELKLEELSLVNVLRREGCPLVVTSDDGKTIYEEGKDFLPVRDDKLGQVPYSGNYEFGHPGAVLTLTEKSRIKDGDKLLVSWYHPVLTHGSQIMCCLGEPKLYEMLRDEAKRVNELFHPKTFFMSHDEMRVGGWCKACQKLPGELIENNVRRCVDILKEISPKAEVVVWSDMFDPHHNAVKRYYLMNGSVEGAWKGLPKNVIIGNWNAGKASDSLKWFDGRGHRQIIAGFYDGDENASLKRWSAAAKDMPQVFGFMYTTWQNDFSQLEAYGKAMQGKE